jgi:hypothetical protein
MLNNWKQITYRNEPYLQFIREQECCVPGCHVSPCDPHHCNTKGNLSGGMSLKCDDTLAIPLCRIHHSEAGNCGRSFFQEKHKINFIEIQRNLLQKFVMKIKPMKED